ncbi:hypothetical protein HAX54_002324 [Datura stramonium]|uniref:Uncharacterized protein n=1 Tax=Datura stramonium TaxID=4076 RepID=A0ABS8T4K4_DATST|nr:hypothetical protein [Datura stramonium]
MAKRGQGRPRKEIHLATGSSPPVKALTGTGLLMEISLAEVKDSGMEAITGDGSPGVLVNKVAIKPTSGVVMNDVNPPIVSGNPTMWFGSNSQLSREPVALEILIQETQVSNEGPRASTGMTLTFKPLTVVDGRPVVMLETPEIDKQTTDWDNAIVV